MNFIIKLSKFKKSTTEFKYNSIMIVIDRFIKKAYFVLFHKKMRAEDVIYLIFLIIVIFYMICVVLTCFFDIAHIVKYVFSLSVSFVKSSNFWRLVSLFCWFQNVLSVHHHDVVSLLSFLLLMTHKSVLETVVVFLQFSFQNVFWFFWLFFSWICFIRFFF